MIGAYLFKIWGLKDLTALDFAGIIPVLIILAVAAWFWMRKWRRGDIAFTEKFILSSIMLAFLLHVAAGSRIPTMHPRYMAYFLMLLFGLVLGAVGDRRILGVLFFCVLFGYNMVGHDHFFKRSNHYIEPWSDIARMVDAAVRERGDSCATVVSDMGTGHTVAFYSSLAGARFYAVPPSLPPTEYVRIVLFGHEYFSPLYSREDANRLYPIAGTISFADIVRERKCGVLIGKSRYSRTLQERFRRRFGSMVTTEVIRVVRSNQGDISIIGWSARSSPE